MFKKIITSIILACFIFVNAGVYFVDTVHATETNTWYYQDFFPWLAKVYDTDNPDEIFGERYTAAQVEWVIYGLFAWVLNHIIGNIPLVGCMAREIAIGNEDWLGTCASEITNFICTLVEQNIILRGPALIVCGVVSSEEDQQNLAAVNPVQEIVSGERPISGFGYVRNKLSKFNLATEVKAQGFGFEAANSVRTAWVAVRNATYFLLVLLIIGMAFLIMFRFKINPQTVITIQSALPKIIGALLLITFSYAIAGFMIDLMYVIIGLLAAILSQSGLFTSPNNEWYGMYKDLSGIGIGQGIWGVFTLYQVYFLIVGFAAFSSNLLFWLSGGIFGLIGFISIIICSIALLVIFFKTVFMLIKTYVLLLLLIAAGPIYIIVGGFGKWLQELAGKLAVFVVIGPMLAISFLFLASALPDTGPADDLLANAIPFDPVSNVFANSSWTPPFVGLNDLDIVWLFASFIVMTLIPKVADIVKNTIEKRPFGYGTAIGEPFGPVKALPRRVYKTGQAVGGAYKAIRDRLIP